MSDKSVITLIGAASITFGPKVFRDVINHPNLDGCELRLVDIHEEHLQQLAKVARLVFEKAGRKIEIKASTNRKELLPGSDYVLIAVEVNHTELWRQDFAIPKEMGSQQVTGELGGPGGFFHSLRQIPVHLDIAHDIADLCPEAMVQIMSNPLDRLCLALEHYSGVGQIVGLCHGVEMSENFFLTHVLDIPATDIETTAAGTNHFTWILDMHQKSTGRDLYPLFDEKIPGFDPTHSRLTRKMYEIFGILPTCGGGHFGEYLPYAIEFCHGGGPNFDNQEKQYHARWKYFEMLSSGKVSLEEYVSNPNPSPDLMAEHFFAPRSWADTLCIPIISAQRGTGHHRMPALNLLNQGAIDNLSHDVFVETPGIVDASGVRALHIGNLPDKVAPLNQRHIDQTFATVEAAVTGDRKLALQAMLLDPTADSIVRSEKILNHMLEVQKDYLPQFQ